MRRFVLSSISSVRFSKSAKLGRCTLQKGFLEQKSCFSTKRGIDSHFDDVVVLNGKSSSSLNVGEKSRFFSLESRSTLNKSDKKLDQLGNTHRDLNEVKEEIAVSEKKPEEKNTVAEKDEKEDHNEIKDSEIIFSTIWNKLEAKYGRENMRFPREIIWLMGSPGAGKSFNAPFILKAREITADEIIISDLLTSEDAKKIKKEAGLVGDSLVLELLLERLTMPKYSNGVLVDGFPRTKVQVECIKMLKEKMEQLRSEFKDTPLNIYFRRPSFRVAVLFVDEKESVERQLKRGREVKEHNSKVRESGVGQLKEERPTDQSEELARRRYGVFKDHYSTLQELAKFFTFSVINTKYSVERVRQKILKEFQYQSSLELSSDTYDTVSKIPIANEVTQHSRQNLVRRLDHYQSEYPQLFTEVVEIIKREFMGPIQTQSISGTTEIRSNNDSFNKPLVVEMILDVLAERGYRVAYHQIHNQVPHKVDLQTGYITCHSTVTHVFVVRFKASTIRSDF